MSDFPWFPFWVSDFLTSRKVRTMTPSQVGVYILLLCYQWEDGPLPDDDLELCALANGADTNTVRTVLERCFEMHVDGWVNVRLEDVREEQESKRMQKVRAGRASGKARRRKKIRPYTEHRSNSVATDVERTLNESESESDTEKDTTVHKRTDPFPVKPKKDASGQYLYPEPFERAWSAYPTRDGSNPKVGAYKAFRARVASGDDPEDLIRSAEHYRKHLQAKQRDGTEFVKQASTFWGPQEPWREFIEPMSTNGHPRNGTAPHKPRDLSPEHIAEIEASRNQRLGA